VEVNGREYPMWGQFIERKEEWFSGVLQDLEGGEIQETEIIDITLKPNGETDAFFMVHGKDFCCGGSTEFLGITAGEKGWLTLSGYGGHKWRFKQKEGSDVS